MTGLHSWPQGTCLKRTLDMTTEFWDTVLRTGKYPRIYCSGFLSRFMIGNLWWHLNIKTNSTSDRQKFLHGQSIILHLANMFEYWRQLYLKAPVPKQSQSAPAFAPLYLQNQWLLTCWSDRLHWGPCHGGHLEWLQGDGYWRNEPWIQYI